MLQGVVEGQTDPLVFQLSENGTALSGTGLTLSDIVIVGTDGAQVESTGKVGWYNQPSGQVQFSQTALDLRASRSPYTVRVKLTDANAKTRFYPDDVPELLRVWPALSKAV